MGLGVEEAERRIAVESGNADDAGFLDVIETVGESRRRSADQCSGQCG